MADGRTVCLLLGIAQRLSPGVGTTSAPFGVRCTVQPCAWASALLWCEPADLVDPPATLASTNPGWVHPSRPSRQARRVPHDRGTRDTSADAGHTYTSIKAGANTNVANPLRATRAITVEAHSRCSLGVAGPFKRSCPLPEWREIVEVECLVLANFKRIHRLIWEARIDPHP